MNMLAIYLRIEHKWSEAEAIDWELLPMQRKLFGNRHLCVGDTLARMADEFLNQNRLDEAENCDHEAASIYHDARGKDNHDMIQPLTHLSRIRMKRGDLAEAESLLRQAISCDNESHPTSAGPLTAALLELAEHRRATNDMAQADALMVQAVGVYEKFSESEPSIALLNAGALLAIKGQQKGDPASLERYLEFLHKTIGRNHKFPGGGRFEFSTSMDQLSKLLAEAEHVARDALAVQASEDSEYKLRNFVKRRLVLGDILVRESKFAEAEQTLAEARTVQEQDPRSDNGRRLGLYGRLLNLYEKWEKPDQAAEWRQKRDELKSVQAATNSAPPGAINSPATATNLVSAPVERTAN
jgi:eukaryotic-like serine/threonine-protein kinase